MTFPRSHSNFLQSPSRTPDSLYSALTSKCPDCSGHLLGGRSQPVPVPGSSLLSVSMSAWLPGRGQGLCPTQGCLQPGCAAEGACVWVRACVSWTSQGGLGPPSIWLQPTQGPLSGSVFKWEWVSLPACQGHCGEHEHAFPKHPSAPADKSSAGQSRDGGRRVSSWFLRWASGLSVNKPVTSGKSVAGGTGGYGETHPALGESAQGAANAAYGESPGS